NFLVGRADELDLLETSRKVAATGERRAVLLAGEPGIGKTRLVAEMAARAAADGALVLYGGCEEDLGLAYQPFVEAFEGHLASLPTESIRALAGSRLGELVRLLPGLAVRLPEALPASDLEP